MSNLFSWGARVVDTCLGSPSAWCTDAPLGTLRLTGKGRSGAGFPVDIPEALADASFLDAVRGTAAKQLVFRLTSCFSGLGTAELCGQVLNRAFASHNLAIHLEWYGV